MTTVLAYLDPGSGSMILQIIAGGVAAVAVTAKLYWNRMLSVPAHPSKDEPEAAEPAAARAPTPPSDGLGRPPGGFRRRPLLFGAARAAAH